jgi:hypothetical protein
MYTIIYHIHIPISPCQFLPCPSTLPINFFFYSSSPFLLFNFTLSPISDAHIEWVWFHPSELEKPTRGNTLKSLLLSEAISYLIHILCLGKARTLHFVFHSTSSAFTFLYLPLLQSLLSLVRVSLIKASHLGLITQAFLTTLNIYVSLQAVKTLF